MKLVVITHKSCWTCAQSPSGYATDGGFPRQMEALSQLFESTVLLLPCEGAGPRSGQTPLVGRGLSVTPLTPLGRGNWQRKLLHPWWVLRNLPTLCQEMAHATGVHALVPGDVGTTGMILAAFLDKPLLVRHCGNWTGSRSLPERFCHWFMERFAGGNNVMLATGAGEQSPSPKDPRVRWIFSSSLHDEELRAHASAGPKSLNSGSTLRLICASRQEPAKGTRIIIAALPKILERHPNVRLDVVGDGSCLRELKTQARAMNLESHIVFHGKVSQGEVVKLLQQAHLFCFPTSSSEGFPKGVLEALSCGLPVITTGVSVLPRLIAQGPGCGLILNQNDPATLAQAVVKVIDDPQRYHQMSIQAIEVASSYSLENWRDTIGEWLRGAWGLGANLAARPVCLPLIPSAPAAPASMNR